ncbi:MAG: hypothetical protein ACHQJ6_03985 [Candidatus Berkiellales bacterium]
MSKMTGPEDQNEFERRERLVEHLKIVRSKEKNEDRKLALDLRIAAYKPVDNEKYKLDFRQAVMDIGRLGKDQSKSALKNLEDTILRISKEDDVVAVRKVTEEKYPDNPNNTIVLSLLIYYLEAESSKLKEEIATEKDEKKKVEKGANKLVIDTRILTLKNLLQNKIYEDTSKAFSLLDVDRREAAVNYVDRVENRFRETSEKIERDQKSKVSKKEERPEPVVAGLKTSLSRSLKGFFLRSSSSKKETSSANKVLSEEASSEKPPCDPCEKATAEKPAVEKTAAEAERENRAPSPSTSPKHPGKD